MEFHFNNVWTALSETFPDRPALVCEGKTVTWSQFNGRAARLAGLFSRNGVTNGASVGMYMLNCNEYAEAHFGCFKQSVCPVNVNYRYRAEELIYLLDNSDAEVVIYHASYAPRIAEIRESLPKIKLYIQVEDESGNSLLDGALDYETALADSTPLPFSPSATMIAICSTPAVPQACPRGSCMTTVPSPIGCASVAIHHAGYRHPLPSTRLLRERKPLLRWGPCTEACPLAPKCTERACGLGPWLL